MMMQDNQVHPVECKCWSWKPIFAGALAAIGFSFLLNLFGVAIGLTAYTTTSDGVQNLALGGLIATALGIVVSMFGAGWLAGFLGTRFCTQRCLGALYGFLTWCVALVITVFLAQHVQEYVVYYTHFVAGSYGPVSPTVPPASQQAEVVTISAYVVFALFFLSAFACSLGGHCGMRHVCKKECPPTR